MPEQRTSAYAEEGELAHELSEVMLLANINKIDKVTAIKRADEIEKQCDLKGIGDMEKLIGKKEFPKILGDYIEKPKGKPTLAPKSDKRDPWSETSSDDFDVSDL